MDTSKMIDGLLLFHAAKAAGLNFKRGGEFGLWVDAPNPVNWNPLEDDADVQRLAVKLGLKVEYLQTDGITTAAQAEWRGVRVNVGINEGCCGGDAYKAARRAITHVVASVAAAEDQQ